MKKAARSRWTGFLACLVFFSLWLIFVIDIWENGAYVTISPEVKWITRFANKPYLISAGLPVMAFCLISGIPAAIGSLFPGWWGWKKWYTAAGAVILTATAALMLASGDFYLNTGIARAFFRRPYAALEKMQAYYLRTIPVSLGVSVAAFLICLCANTLRKGRKAFWPGIRRTAEKLMYSTAVGILICVTAQLLLNLLADFYSPELKSWVSRFCIGNAQNRERAWISLVVAPIMEEIAFRGVMCRGLAKKGPRWLAVVISSLFFGLWHRNPAQFAYTLPHGLIFGYCALATGSIIWPMVMHFVNNLMAILAYSEHSYMVLGAWPGLVALREWLQQLPAAGTLLLLAASIAGILFLLRKIRQTG